MTERRKTKRGDYPPGVSLVTLQIDTLRVTRKKGPDKYQAQIMRYGKQEYLGTFNTIAAASSAYCKAKAEDHRDQDEEQQWAEIYEKDMKER